MRTDHGVTPLHFASQIGHLEMVRTLLAHGADVDKAGTDDGSTPLIMAVMSNQVRFDAVKMLVDAGAKIDIVEKHFQNNALHWAADISNDGICEILCKAAPQLLSVRNSNGQTPHEIAKAKTRDPQPSKKLLDMLTPA